MANNECDFIVIQRGDYLGVGQGKKMFAQLNEQNIQDQSIRIHSRYYLEMCLLMNGSECFFTLMLIFM